VCLPSLRAGLGDPGIRSRFPAVRAVQVVVPAKADGMDAPSRYGIDVPEWKWVSTNSREGGVHYEA
jgi:hypothetical protein